MQIQAHLEVPNEQSSKKYIYSPLTVYILLQPLHAIKHSNEHVGMEAQNDISGSRV